MVAGEEPQPRLRNLLWSHLRGLAEAVSTPACGLSCVPNLFACPGWSPGSLQRAPFWSGGSALWPLIMETACAVHGLRPGPSHPLFSPRDVDDNEATGAKLTPASWFICSLIQNPGIRMQGASRLPNSTIYVVEPGYLGECGHPGSFVITGVKKSNKSNSPPGNASLWPALPAGRPGTSVPPCPSWDCPPPPALPLSVHRISRG